MEIMASYMNCILMQKYNLFEDINQMNFLVITTFCKLSGKFIFILLNVNSTKISTVSKQENMFCGHKQRTLKLICKKIFTCLIDIHNPDILTFF